MYKKYTTLNFSILYTYKKSESHFVMPNSLQPQGLYSPRSSPGQNTGVDSHSLLQGIFPSQRSNPGLLHCRQILYQLSHQGSPIRKVSRRLFYISVSLLLSRIQGYCYHLSKFHIYALIYCICVFLSGLH